MTGGAVQCSAFVSRRWIMIRTDLVAGAQPQSSPHARGTPHMDPGEPTSPTVHPRMRGEHARSQFLEPFLFGSSPHAQGTRPTAEHGAMPGRFIPARAGDTGIQHRCAATRTVHPRMRGEHSTITVARRRAAGSSPHAQGTPDMRRFAVGRERFIPACAGNTLRREH
jgi:hypothetical protein